MNRVVWSKRLANGDGHGLQWAQVSQFGSSPWDLYCPDSIQVRSQSEGVKPKMRGRKLRSGVSWKEALNQKGGRIGVKQGLGVVLNVAGSRPVSTL